MVESFNIRELSLFDSNWLSSAFTRAPQDSWAHDVLLNLASNGGIYLATLKAWFARFPKPSIEMKNQLENFVTSAHLGAVNEIFWWEWMKRFHWVAEPVDGKKQRRPDFHVTKPFDFFCEVTTQNISDEVKEKLSKDHAIDLKEERARTMERLFVKAQQEKLDQIRYGASQGRPSVLVLFDYTFWSAFGVPFDKLSGYLFGEQKWFLRLPSELSAIVYADRQVQNGRLGINQRRSAVYHNPYAQFRLPKTVFRMLFQHESTRDIVSPAKSLLEPEEWIWAEA
jgi:hypothetical protein